MTAHSATAEVASSTGDPSARVRDALGDEGVRLALFRAIRPVVSSGMRGRTRDQIEQRVLEVLAETAARALADPGSLDPGRSVVPWLFGIARNVVRGDVRASAVRSRRVISLDRDDPAWDRLTQTLSGVATADARIDLEAMLARLGPSSRHALESRYLRGLSGRELADALGAPTVGAAKVRVTRAKQELLDLFAEYGREVAR